MPDMIRTNLYLTEQQRAELIALGGEGLAAHVRAALDLYLALLTGDLLEVMAEARTTFDDVQEDDPAQLIRRTLLHWWHNRNENSHRAMLRRIEAKVDTLLQSPPMITDAIIEKINHDALCLLSAIMPDEPLENILHVFDDEEEEQNNVQ